MYVHTGRDLTVYTRSRLSSFHFRYEVIRNEPVIYENKSKDFRCFYFLASLSYSLIIHVIANGVKTLGLDLVSHSI